jgi:UDP-glucose 4-epimerase
MQILVTGASGFIGSFIVEKAMELGHDVWAGIRPTSSRRYLQDKRIHFIELNLEDMAVLQQQLCSFKTQSPYGWDIVIHAAGATKGKDRDDFFKTNYKGTQHLVESLRLCNMLPKRMIYLSSLSVLGGIRQQPVSDEKGHVYAPILDDDKAEPNTAYGESKLAAEEYLRKQTDLDFVILRPTGVYGPREKDYFLMAKSIKQHIDFSVGFKPQEITFVYVKDLVDAVFLVSEKGERSHSYFVSDGNTYSSKDFSVLLQKEMGITGVLHIKAPLWLLRLICNANTLLSKVTGKLTALNNDKYHILKQRNWRCDISPITALGYEPHYNLEKGVRETIAWYKKEKWI